MAAAGQAKHYWSQGSETGAGSPSVDLTAYRQTAPTRTMTSESKNSRSSLSTSSHISIGCSALDLLTAQQRAICIPSGVTMLDTLLSSSSSAAFASPYPSLGGLLIGEGLYELCGMPGSGKTQLAMQWCVYAQLLPHLQQPQPSPNVHPSFPSPGSGCPTRRPSFVFVDSEGSFFPERYLQIAEAVISRHRKYMLDRRVVPGRSVPRLVASMSSPGAAASSFVNLPSASDLLHGLEVLRVFDCAELQRVLTFLYTRISTSRPSPLELISPGGVAAPGIGWSKEAFSYTHDNEMFGGVLIVDGWTALLRQTMLSASYHLRNATLQSLTSSLSRLNPYMGIVLTNTMTTKFLHPSRSSVFSSPTATSTADKSCGAALVVPALGPAWVNVPVVRVVLREIAQSDRLGASSGTSGGGGGTGGRRVAEVVKSRRGATGEVMFEIQRDGMCV
eukprot:GHVS01021648.1.p1 GENE.GHVS01021648.1~~GHVS01021648.1.p1  ORF type:complete len:463 (-),score=41.39 GHVS01021648.1:287-1624(-)